MNIDTCKLCGALIGNMPLHTAVCTAPPPPSEDEMLALYLGPKGDLSYEPEQDGWCWICNEIDAEAPYVGGRGVRMCRACALDPDNHNLHCRDL